ncbi:MAG: hypothetical protein A3I14_05355 [Candidatus Rokubacteria bacterium RIFCSPLOWO2_02_FULL_73_56]|nr:MAG: hypothetical protein A3D33_12125 [Candidatus Rokubacteria bacterium RIFCSPHIGHO2_02_FULL_73_26]OGL08592.1 MAG: hypothetical protein A3I14_05355 [Candidatus Rokubacteria bacterium RIFCSPLOWO2_02_FULL_73_56]OGL24612.1 MAG: hypothetical protein A3G44_17945 [Candidatus Rokubacteria bacterium RIFCSPLOWO2_12_FULL_73_47]
MSLGTVLQALELLDSAVVTGQAVGDAIRAAGVPDVEVERFTGARGSTDFVRVTVPGARGRRAGGEAPTLGIVGRLGGIGARPAKVGLVSDGDGAVTAIACALKLGRMAAQGDRLPGDVILATHICPDAPTIAHPVVTMMNSPVDMATLNRHEVRPEMEAILSVDTTRGNRVVNQRGIAISPTVKEGWILRVAEDLLTIVQNVTGRMPVVLPLTMQDITPYGNDLFHVNSILQPATATAVPVVGVALTAEVPVPGSATGASQAVDIDLAVRFCLEVAKAFGAGLCRFHDPAEWDAIQRRYGSMSVLQTLGRA